MDIKMLNHVVLVLLCWLCRILQSLHPGGGHRDSCYTASTEKFLEECHRLLLCICSENQLCPKPSISPSSSRHRKTTWNLCVAVSHSWKMNYWEVGNLCSSKCRDEMAAVKITATPLRQNSATFELQQPGPEKVRETTAGQVRHQECLYLTCGVLDKLTLY